MYGDTTAIRALARRLRERADEIRDLAADLSDHADTVPWSGLAADAMRAHAVTRLCRLMRTAELHDDAAEAVERHAREVDRLTGLLDAGVEVLGGAGDFVKGVLT